MKNFLQKRNSLFFIGLYFDLFNSFEKLRKKDLEKRLLYGKDGETR